MKIPIIDVVMFVCCAISLALYTISGFRKKMNFKEMFETRIEKVFFTLMKITFINALFYLVLFGTKKGISQEEMNKMFFWFILLISTLMWFGENTINGFKESRQAEGYTKLDYVASGFLLVASFLLIFKIVLMLPEIIF